MSDKKPQKTQFQDLTLYDKDTGEPFIFTAKEQEFFARQGFTHVPTRSPERRKLLRERRFEGKDVFNITCKKCKRVGKIMQEPWDNKEIYCEDCFEVVWQQYLEANPDYRQEYELAEYNFQQAKLAKKEAKELEKYM